MSQWEVTTPSHLQIFTSLIDAQAPKLDPEKSYWEVTIPDLQVFTSPVVQSPKLDLEKSQWEVKTPSHLQVFTSLVDMRAPKLDPKKSQYGSRPQVVFKSSRHLWVCELPSWTLKGASGSSQP